jgi:hypothetical protein
MFLPFFFFCSIGDLTQYLTHAAQELCHQPSSFSFIVVLGGVHCGICKGSYKYQIYDTWIHCPSCPISLSFISLLPWFLEQFQQVWFLHLHTCVHIICSIFIFLHTFPTTSSLPLVPNPTPKDLFCPPVPWFYRRKRVKDENMMLLLVWGKDSYRRSFHMIFPCIHVLQPQLVHFL